MRCAFHRDRDAIFNCYLCKRAICVDCESKLRGRSICPGCADQIWQRQVDAVEAESKHPNCPCAFLTALVAAGATAFAWSQVVVLTGRRLDVLALALGGLVAYGAMRGAGGKRGHTLQQMAAALALAGILFAHFLVLLRTQAGSYTPLSGAGSPAVGALYAFPGYLSGLGILAWVSLVAGLALAYWLPRIRTIPGRPRAV